MNLVSANEPWLDKVPSDWQASRIRNVAQLSPGHSNGAPGSDELCTVVPMELVSGSGVIDTSSQQRAEDINGGLTLFENGDVIFAKITPCMENGKGAFDKGAEKSITAEVSLGYIFDSFRQIPAHFQYLVH